jgi:hypothetical protein
MEILTIFLMTAISCPRREDYVRAIRKLEGNVQAEIAQIIQKVSLGYQAPY